jgi:hypothetical protein
MSDSRFQPDFTVGPMTRSVPLPNRGGSMPRHLVRIALGARELPRLRRLYGKGRRFAVCVDNTGYEASLERNKIYLVRPDQTAEEVGELRVVDESGEDYLFSADRFGAIDVPAAVKASLLNAS